MIGGRMAALAAAAALVTGAAAQASPACWRAEEAQAAQVRRMQTMLMVATLRCRAAKIDIVADYDAFVTRQGAAIAAANLRIKRHFAAQGGVQADYDRFATSLANDFGDDDTTEATCAEAAALAREAAAGDAGTLDGLATARLFPATLAGGSCDAPASDPIAASPPPPLREPVTLPAEIVAALTVMARFHDAATGATPPVPVSTRLAAIAP